MNRILADLDIEQNQPLSSTTSSHNMQKKGKTKFTMLDDIDQLNEIINGPGANQQTQKAQQVLQKTYQYMKGNQSSVDSQSQNINIRLKSIQNNQKDSRKQYESKQMDEKQNKRDIINLEKEGQTQKLQQQLKNLKGPRIIITLKKIDLTKEPNSADFYLKGLQNLLPIQGNDGTRAPSNSMRQNQEDASLFTKALQKTQRQKNQQTLQINTKEYRNDTQIKSKR